MSLWLSTWLPRAVVVLTGALMVAYLVRRWRSRAGARRPVLVALSLLAVLLAVVPLLGPARLADVPHVRFDRPWLALPAALVLLAMAARLERQSARQHRLRRTLIELGTLVAASAAALGLVGVEAGVPLDRMSVIVAIDRSRSIDLVPGAESRIGLELRVAEQGMRDDDLIGTLAFGANAAIEDPLRNRSRLPAAQKAEIGRDGTDLGAAIRHALGELPSDAAARIAILSDGVSTRGDALDQAMAAVAAGVPIDVVPLDQAAVPNVRVIAARIASRASEGEPLALRVVTSATKASKVTLRVFRDGEPIRQGEVEINEGEDVIHLREVAPEPGFHRYDVELSALDPAQDKASEDNSGTAFVRVRGQNTALVLDRGEDMAAPLVSALRSAAFLTDFKGPAGVPGDVAGFAAYDVVVLGDIAASELSPTQMDAIATYVKDLGGGLLLMGGDRSFGPGGYGKTPIEEVSPLAFDLKQERRRASLAEIIAIDISGSMAMNVGKQTKLELANEAAARSADLLGAGDRLGVMHVDTAVQWSVPLGPVTDKAEIMKKIRAVTPGGGGIFVDITLEAAYAALAKDSVQLKHLLLFADGADAEERNNAFAIVSGAKARGITTSVVALGRGSDVPALEQMSRLGGGRFYLVEDATRLPAIFAQETIVASRSAINETVFKPAPVVNGAPLRGIDLSQAPALTGYVVTIPKGRSQVLLGGPEGDPILATWSAGIGRAAAFTSDFKDRWGLGWTSWEGASRLFGQLARDIARRADDPRVRLEAETVGGELALRANVVDERGRAESFRRLRVVIGGPDGISHSLPLEAVGAGSYAATLPLSRPGAYMATAIDEVSGEAVGIAGAALSPGEELKPTGTDRAMLGRIAELTGGKMRDTLAGLYGDRPPRRFAYTPLSPWLMIAAAFALLFTVAARRISPPERLARLPADLRQARKARTERRSHEAVTLPPQRQADFDALKR
ncbi:MAG TPA: VWA domain-containing protein, partial [Polyangiaceae bacterium]|nr:VWA domain-containing protein [Polyangiaceae bacterium]